MTRHTGSDARTPRGVVSLVTLLSRVPRVTRVTVTTFVTLASLLVVVSVPSAVAAGTVASLAARPAALPAAPPDAPPPPPPDAPADAPPPTLAPSTGSLIPVPAGCPVPDPAAVAFVGTMTGKDDVTQTVRFRIDQLRAGSASPWAIDGLIDVRYGADYRFLDEGEQYLVGAGFDPSYGALSSTVRPPEPTFGGNDVVGVDDVAVTCPDLDDPVRTLNVDGTSVDSGVLSLLGEDRRLLLATIAVPTAIAFAALLALVILKMFGGLMVRGVFQLGRAAVTPVPDHRAVRVRRHRDTVDVSGSGSDALATDGSGEPVSDPASR